jgi:hypothetical protein
MAVRLELEVFPGMVDIIYALKNQLGGHKPDIFSLQKISA